MRGQKERGMRMKQQFILSKGSELFLFSHFTFSSCAFWGEEGKKSSFSWMHVKGLGRSISILPCCIFLRRGGFSSLKRDVLFQWGLRSRIQRGEIEKTSLFFRQSLKDGTITFMDQFWAWFCVFSFFIFCPTIRPMTDFEISYLSLSR